MDLVLLTDGLGSRMMGRVETERFVVIGRGGMARCILDLVDVINGYGVQVYEVVGILADIEPDMSLLKPRGVEFLGDIDELANLPEDVGFTIGLGDGRLRYEIDRYGRRLGRQSPTIVHPNAHLGYDVQLGPGSVICSHVSMENNIRLGRHVHVNQNSTIGHDSRLDDYATVSPLVAVSGSVTLEHLSFVGTGAAIHERTTIGRRATVGMGAVVLHDVPTGATVVGNPAREAPRSP